MSHLRLLVLSLAAEFLPLGSLCKLADALGPLESRGVDGLFMHALRNLSGMLLQACEELGAPGIPNDVLRMASSMESGGSVGVPVSPVTPTRGRRRDNRHSHQSHINSHCPPDHHSHLPDSDTAKVDVAPKTITPLNPTTHRLTLLSSLKAIFNVPVLDALIQSARDARGPAPRRVPQNIYDWAGYNELIGGWEREEMVRDFRTFMSEGSAVSKAFAEWEEQEFAILNVWKQVVSNFVVLVSSNTQRFPLDETKETRKNKLELELELRGCRLRGDSKLCVEYIEDGKYDPVFIAEIMEEMKFLVTRTSYEAIKRDMEKEENLRISSLEHFGSSPKAHERFQNKVMLRNEAKLAAVLRFLETSPLFAVSSLPVSLRRRVESHRLLVSRQNEAEARQMDIQKQLERFSLSVDDFSVEFSTSIPEDRKYIHEASDRLSLKHESRGKGEARRVVVWKIGGGGEDEGDDDGVGDVFSAIGRGRRYGGNLNTGNSGNGNGNSHSVASSSTSNGSSSGKSWGGKGRRKSSNKNSSE